MCITFPYATNCFNIKQTKFHFKSGSENAIIMLCRSLKRVFYTINITIVLNFALQFRYKMHLFCYKILDFRAT